MTQMQWSFGITNMPGGQNLVIGSSNPLGIDYGPYGYVHQSEYAYESSGLQAGYVVPAGHVLGLTAAGLESKFALWGNYHLPTMEIITPQHHAQFIDQATIQYPAIAHRLQPCDPDVAPNAAAMGVEASSYLVLPGICTITDIEGHRRFAPPLLMPEGARLTLIVVNNHGAQSMGIVVQGLLAPLNGRELTGVFV